jgi:hypothetical protein
MVRISSGLGVKVNTPEATPFLMTSSNFLQKADRNPAVHLLNFLYDEAPGLQTMEIIVFKQLGNDIFDHFTHLHFRFSIFDGICKF